MNAHTCLCVWCIWCMWCVVCVVLCVCGVCVWCVSDVCVSKSAINRQPYIAFLFFQKCFICYIQLCVWRYMYVYMCESMYVCI